jgi:hypothetical protein
MQNYRVFCLDLHGRSVEAKELKASSDEEAIRKAKVLPGLRQCEIWQAQRLVAKITEFSTAS